MTRISRRTLALGAAAVAAVAGGAIAVTLAAGPATPAAALPAPAIGTRPPLTTTVGWATFSFRDHKPVAAYQCALDGRSPHRCANPVTFRNLGAGTHLVVVQPLGADGRVGAAASYRWHVAKTVKGFAITGHLTQQLRPGGTARLDLAISNPYPYAIAVSALHVTPKNGTAAASTARGRCDAAKAIRVTQYAGAALTIQPNETITLASRHVDAAGWPQLLAADDPGCAAASVSFAYSGRAKRA
ncbi:MAG: hypothetical protein QOI35_2617 [Cryptosporangiaceae bacterium]|jgi:hypothetical protein|nr:hypothetical protein [Cryptosporangiaceae bacterium]MDQ1657889.1 hypothetical protein [Cryptosporangiaceae bacterium]